MPVLTCHGSTTNMVLRCAPLPVWGAEPMLRGDAEEPDTEGRS